MEDSSLAGQIEKDLSLFSGLSLGFAGCAPELYVLIRAVRPRTVVETGVANGVSSAYILQAIRRNETGSLVSISLPSERDPLIPAGKTLGWVVPQELRDNWELCLGKSSDLLPRLLKLKGSVDICFHDSDHSFENMTFELEKFRSHVSPGGYIVCDDVWRNGAFQEFCQRYYLHPSYLRNAGIARAVYSSTPIASVGLE